MNKYNVIYADPPWKFNNVKTGGSLTSGASSQYPVMDLKSICSLPVKDIADDNCVLFMWWVASQPAEALRVVNSWGFTIKTMTGFNWVKRTKHDKPFFGMGFWTRAGSECCLIATKGKPKPLSRGVRSVQEYKAGRHSAKPDEFRDHIDTLCGNVPRIELFARTRVNNWDAWGNQLTYSDITL